jgi:hypothetical protein
MNDKHGYAQPNIQNMSGNEHQIAANNNPTPVVATQLTSRIHPQRKAIMAEQQKNKLTPQQEHARQPQTKL